VTCGDRLRFGHPDDADLQIGEAGAGDDSVIDRTHRLGGEGVVGGVPDLPDR
jgi:hypothetical protein